jgi:GT2 family glycosyltransferase
MEESIDLSVIIVSYNTKKLLEDCINSVKKSFIGSSVTYEIIVIDNVSTDGSREMLASSFKDVRVILNDNNVGFGKANNQGMDISRGSYILLLNSDTVVLGDALVKLLHFCRQKNHAFVGAKLLNKDRSPQTSCGPFLTLPVVFAALFLKGDRLGLTRFSPNKPTKVDWISGACIMAPKKLFQDGLKFDESIFMYMEEIDLLYRAAKKGYKTYFTPSAKIVHYGAASSQNKRKQPVLNIFRGLQYFYKRHYSPIELFLLKILLRSKAIGSYIIGLLIGNTYLKETYAEALKLV